MEKKNNADCGCGGDFNKEVNSLVNEAGGYSSTDHRHKQAEVNAAFADHSAHKSGNTAGHANHAPSHKKENNGGC